MSFTPGIPRSGQSLGNSRPQVQGNFDYINTAFAINHVAFDSTGVGKHKFLQMPEQSPNGPATLAGEGALYTKASSGTQLFWRPENTANNGTEVQMTNVTPSNANGGYTFLPGGLLIQFGKVTLNSSGVATVNFGQNFTLAGVNTNPWSIQVSIVSDFTGQVRSVGISTGSVMSSQFSISSFLGNSRDVYWIAIGPKT